MSVESELVLVMNFNLYSSDFGRFFRALNTIRKYYKMKDQEKRKNFPDASSSLIPDFVVRMHLKSSTNKSVLSLEERWQQFINALTTFSPKVAARFRFGASDRMIHEAEERLQMNIPQELRSFFHLQNGSGGALFDGWSFLSLQEACDDWEQMKAQTPSIVRPQDKAYAAWKEDWFPLLHANADMRVYMRISNGETFKLRKEISPPSSLRDALSSLQKWQHREFLYGEDDVDVENSLARQEGDDALTSQTKGVPRSMSVIPREHWAPLFLSQLPSNEVATSINELLEILTVALENKGYVYDSYANLMRSILSYSFLPQLNEPSWYELPYELPGMPFVSGKEVAYPGLCCVPLPQRNHALSLENMDQSVNQSWQIISSTLMQIAPVLAHTFRPGVSDQELAQTEEQLHCNLPEDVKQWYRLCNGRKEMSYIKYVMDCWRWNPLEVLRRGNWERELEGDYDPPTPYKGQNLANTDPRIQPVWWNPGWISFMNHIIDGSELCVDLTPTAQGEVGQIILLIGNSKLYGDRLDRRKIPPAVWVAPNLRVFLAMFAHDLQAGKYLFDTKYETLWSREGFSYIVEDSEFMHKNLVGIDMQYKERFEPENWQGREVEKRHAEAHLATLQEEFQRRQRI